MFPEVPPSLRTGLCLSRVRAAVLIIQAPDLEPVSERLWLVGTRCCWCMVTRYSLRTYRLKRVLFTASEVVGLSRLLQRVSICWYAMLAFPCQALMHMSSPDALAFAIGEPHAAMSANALAFGAIS